MKNLIFTIFLAFATLCVTAEPIQIANATGQMIRVLVGFNTGADCVPVEWHTTCILPDEAAVVESDDETLIPFVIRAYEDCPLSDLSTECWTFNPFPESLCDEMEDVNPFKVTWFNIIGWGAVVSVT